MTPDTFTPLPAQWRLTAVTGPVPSELAATLTDGIPATVPGEATLDLLAAGLIAEPFDGDNEAAQQWIGDVSWRFSCEFDWLPGADEKSAQRVDLVAYGLDTVATVELNGHLVGQTENMFRSYRWDVAKILQPGANSLVVTFAAPVPETLARAEKYGALPRVNHHEYNQLRKMACSFGWDWGIDVAGAGIWKPIGLDSWSQVRIGAVRPLVEVTSVGAGVVAAHVEIERAHPIAAAPVPVVVRVTSPDGSQYKGQGEVTADTNTCVVTVEVPHARLWWPVGHGDQPLYQVEVAGGHGGEAVWRGRVGFRTVSLNTAPDAHGAPFEVRVNGELVLVRGINWIPDDAFLTRVTPQRYRRAIADALGANVNLFRVWGGGIYENDELYDLADEVGILMWQDFLFGCAAYDERPEMWAEIEAEVRENITRLSPHPSLIIWNGNNENTWGSVDWGWAGPLAGRPWGDGYYSDLLPRLVAELDPTRAYSPASPFSFGDYRHPNDERYGTMHIWDVWNRADYRTYRDYQPRFVSEFGFQAPPAWSTLTAVVHDVPLDPFGPQMLVHQKANLGNEKLARGWRGHLPDPKNIKDWHWTTQLNQAQAIRFGVAHFRSLTPLNTGVVLWQLNDNWPVVSWAAVDHNGQRKPLWYVVREVYAPRFATLQPRPSPAAIAGAWEGLPPENDELALVLVNDTGAGFDGTCTIRRLRFDGTELARAELPVAVAARGVATSTVPVEVAAFADPTREVIVVSFDDGASGFARAFLNGAEVVDQHLDPAPVSVLARRVADGYEVRATANSYARDLFLPADQVDPSANVDIGMVTLLAGESTVFRVSSQQAADPDDFAAVLRCANDLRAGNRLG